MSLLRTADDARSTEPASNDAGSLATVGELVCCMMSVVALVDHVLLNGQTGCQQQVHTVHTQS